MNEYDFEFVSIQITEYAMVQNSMNRTAFKSHGTKP